MAAPPPCHPERSEGSAREARSRPEEPRFDPSQTQPKPAPAGRFRLADLRVTVVAIEGRSVCGLQVGDFFEVTESSRLRIPPGRHFCLYALAAILPLLPAKMRALDPNDWLAQDSLVACPDPEERVILRIERLGERELRTEELT